MLDRISARIFADGADLEGILALAEDPRIEGFTTNPTLMRKAGLTDYTEFAHRLLKRVTKHPISFEVFADDTAEIRRQARLIASWGENVYVKIPVTTTAGESLAPLVRELSETGIKVNVTALFTTAQVELITGGVRTARPPASRSLPDASPTPASTRCRSWPARSRSWRALRAGVIWASPREILNVVQADQVGCHIITITHDLLKKLDCSGKNLERYSLETVRMFHGDAVAAGFPCSHATGLRHWRRRLHRQQPRRPPEPRMSRS